MDLRTSSTSAATLSSMFVNVHSSEVSVVLLPLEIPQQKGAMLNTFLRSTKTTYIKKARVVTPSWKISDPFDRRFPSTDIPPSDQIRNVGELSAFEAWKKISDALRNEFVMVEHITKHTNLYVRRDCNNKTYGASKKDIESFWVLSCCLGIIRFPMSNSTGQRSCRYGCATCVKHNEQKPLHGIEEVYPLCRQPEAHQRQHNDLVYFIPYSVRMMLWCNTLVAIVQRCLSGGKPVRFGYKIRMLCGNDGYLYHISIYQGKNQQTSKEPLDTALLKKTRGSFDYRNDGKVYVAKWHDKSLVTVASNWQTHNPLHKCKRRIKGQRRDISQPNLIRSYNTGMGGVDLLDRLSLSYQPSIQQKKWYWPLFVNVLNVATVAAW
ncbi:PiggyBac transposable element-derived protein 3 [Trichinella papuae]|uniref:PiggyBac transposable element-derived protein 3 n=1 Tax=Trichinella papuae TaxID=268474 RepID=A0A0V1MTW5_9BILA|nr:PiggyBac transposable element-derived protein 3 [Trichinella papuae]